MTDMDTHLMAAATHILSAWGESVTYKPFGGAERSILAAIDRPGVRAANGQGKFAANGPEMIVCVLHSATSGITAAEVNTGKDKISLPVRLGKTAQDVLISRILGQDGGMLVLECR